jgi:hypothetical protein
LSWKKTPHLPEGTQVEVELRTPAVELPFECLYALWQLTSTEPLLFLDEACQPAAQALAPQKASYFIQAMGQK